jgi:hypothetical protein
MNDMINCGLEFVGALFLFKNCRLLWSHRRVQGVSVSATIFFTLWGLWNLYFYPANHLWLSFAGGLCLAAANLTWVGMAIHFGRRTRSLSQRVMRDLPPFEMPSAPTHF